MILPNALPRGPTAEDADPGFAAILEALQPNGRCLRAEVQVDGLRSGGDRPANSEILNAMIGLLIVVVGRGEEGDADLRARRITELGPGGTWVEWPTWAIACV